MEITLQERTADHVRIYFERTQDDQIDRMLPRSVNSLDQALENFAQTKLPDAKSYGKTIYADDRYIGDIWCYCIDPKETPNAMLSYCIFEKSCWGKGIASRALSLFLDEIVEKYALSSVGAFHPRAGEKWIFCKGILCGGWQRIGLSGIPRAGQGIGYDLLF